jgi:hypothetical protein
MSIHLGEIEIKENEIRARRTRTHPLISKKGEGFLPILYGGYLAWLSAGFKSLHDQAYISWVIID